MASLAALLVLQLCPLYCPAQTTDGPEGRVSISGVILDPDGQPVRERDVSLWWAWWSNPRCAGRIWRRGGGEVETGPQGQFALYDIPPGFVKLSLGIPDMLPLYSHGPLRIQRAQPTTDVVLRSPGYGGSVTGTVTDESGQLAPDVIVTGSSLAYARDALHILQEHEGEGDTARTGSDGRFRLVNVQPGKRSIRAFARGWAPATSRVEVAEGVHTSTSLTLSRCLPGTWTLTGRVVNARDLPVAGAELAVDYEPGPESVVHYVPEATTTDLGEFLLWGLPPEKPVHVRIYHPEAGVWQADSAGTEGEYRTTTIQMPRALKIRGTVRFSDGTPLPDREIDVSLSGPALDRTHWADLRFRLTTDKHGSYLISGLQPGEWHLQAEIDRGRRMIREALTVERLYTRHDIVFPCPSCVAGRIVGPDGSRVPNAWLLLLGENGRRHGPLWTPDGQFRCEPIDPGKYTAVFWASGFWPATADVEAPEAQRVTAVRLRLGEGAAVSGTVVDGNGQPLGGTAVQIIRLSTTWANVEQAKGPEARTLWDRQMGPLSAMVAYMAPDGVTTSKADGSFTIRGVSPDTIGLFVAEVPHLHPELFTFRPRRSGSPVQPASVSQRQAAGTYIAAGAVLVRLDDGRDVTGADIRAAKAIPDEDLCYVHGIVRDPHRRFPDLAGLTVAVSESSTGSRLDIGPGHALPQLTYDNAALGDDGAFEVHNVPPGDRMVLVGGRDGTYQLARVELDPGQTVDLGELPVPVAGAVEGTVSDAEGHPVSEGVVLASRRESSLSFSAAASNHWKEERTTVGPDGSYSFGELGSGFWHLMAVCPSWTSAGTQRIFVNGGRQRLDFTDSYSGQITGRVADTDGKALAKARITCEGRPLKSRLEAATDEAGRFEIGSLPGGSYSLTPSHQWCLRSPARVVEVDENASPASVEFVLEPGGTIQGLLLGADGQPVREARGEWEVQVGPPWTEEPSAYLMDDGTIRTRVLKPGTYFLRARQKDATDEVPWLESEPIGVYAGQTTTQAVIELPKR